MTENPKLPGHYARRTVSDIALDDIYYPKQHILEMDHLTREIFVYRFEPLKESSKSPKNIMGRVGIMRVLTSNPDTSELTGIIIDARFIKPNGIETSLCYPNNPKDQVEVDECDLRRAGFAQPLALVALDEDSQLVYSGDMTVKSHIDYLVEQTDALRKSLIEKSTEKRSV